MNELQFFAPDASLSAESAEDSPWYTPLGDHKYIVELVFDEIHSFVNLPSFTSLGRDNYKIDAEIAKSLPLGITTDAADEYSKLIACNSNPARVVSKLKAVGFKLLKSPHRSFSIIIYKVLTQQDTIVVCLAKEMYFYAKREKVAVKEAKTRTDLDAEISRLTAVRATADSQLEKLLNIMNGLYNPKSAK